MDITRKVARLQGPILVLGGSGFIGANLFRTLLGCRSDVFGSASRFPAWRLKGLPESNIFTADLLVDANRELLLEKIQPRTVFDCLAYGAYSFEMDSRLIYKTNFNLKADILSRLEPRSISCYIHAGSSSEYGDKSAGPAEAAGPSPNSEYAVSKAACAELLYYFGTKRGLPCANLRLYSVYGPMEDSARLIPTVVQCGLQGRYPDLVSPEISRDFVYVGDVCEAFVDAALNLKPEHYGESINIGSGIQTTIREVAAAAGELFGIASAPVYGSMPDRRWDVQRWFADTARAKERLGWQVRTVFREGLSLTADWVRRLEDPEAYQRSSKRFALDAKHSVSAIIACYKDSQAIPIMYERLKSVFAKLRIDHEIIFVNDNSPDDSEDVIRSLSSRDRHVIGISHSRNFGSQAAFKSGMGIAGMNACVLLDGDLQDPPDLIERFVEKWREGYDVVYGRRVKREAPLLMQFAYKAFYRIFDYFSFIPIPHDAGDCSLMDKKVVQWILQFPERDLFLRGVRAFVGFKQIGVDYVRPRRMFGVTTNSVFKNIGWAKKGILSFSNTPLTILTCAGGLLFPFTMLIIALQVASRLLFPQLSPRGVTMVLLSIWFFGSMNLLGIAMLGEYIAKIFEEVKRRPHFIRRAIIRDGEVRVASGDSPTPS